MVHGIRFHTLRIPTQRPSVGAQGRVWFPFSVATSGPVIHVRVAFLEVLFRRHGARFG